MASIYLSTSIQQGERILSIALIAHVALYSVMPAKAGLSTSPDWMLGIRFGVGGFAGMYLGARCQKFMPQKFIKLMLTTIITFLALKYIVQYFR